jgi:hypothetical protein
MIFRHTRVRIVFGSDPASQGLPRRRDRMRTHAVDRVLPIATAPGTDPARILLG